MPCPAPIPRNARIFFGDDWSNSGRPKECAKLNQNAAVPTGGRCAFLKSRNWMGELATNPKSATSASSPSRSPAASGRTSGRTLATNPTSATSASSPSRSTAISGRTSGRAVETEVLLVNGGCEECAPDGRRGFLWVFSFVELSCSSKCNPTVFRPGALAEFLVVALHGPTFYDSLKGLFCSQRFVSHSRVRLGLVYPSHGVWKLG